MDRRVRGVSAMAVVAVMALAGGFLAWGGEADTNAGREEAWRRMSDLGEGFVIWESDRSGAYRIWRRDLDGTDLRQISPDEQGREHFSPHLCPNGERLVYLSYPHGTDTYSHLPPPSLEVPMYLMNVDGSDGRRIVRSARSFGEDRAVVWFSDEELAYITAEGSTHLLNVTTGAESVLVEGDGRWLVNRTRTHATSGSPTFSQYDTEARTVRPQKSFHGCQPYFSNDGVWGYWMGRGGGPINRVHLATRQVSPIVARDDPRMPAGRNYLYFPMLSSCQRLFSFAASPDQHPHFGSDYDIFVAPIDPKTLELTGDPVRYSFHGATDRFPGVFLRDLELGRRDGEAPLRVRFGPVDGEGPWEWEFGDGGTARGSAVEHVFDKPGDYGVRARRGDRILRGKARARAARAPQMLYAFLADARTIRLSFDEPVEAKGARLDLESRVKIDRWELDSSGQILTVALKSDLTARDRLRVKGVRDRAQRPNTMPTAWIDVVPPQWPTRRDGLLYLWPEAPGAPQTGDTAGEYPWRMRGMARLNHDGALLLADGACVVEGIEGPLLDACRKSDEMSIEALLRPDHLEQEGPARIVTFSTDSGVRNFTLGQQGASVIFRLRTPATGRNGSNPQTTLGDIPAGEPTHVLVTYRSGELVGYLNGEEAIRTQAVQGDFSNWASQPFLFGDEGDGDRDWEGTLEGVAIYNRFIEPDEAVANARQQLARAHSRAEVPRIVIQARLVDLSVVPTLEEINPYREALVTHEYEVTRVLAGEVDGKRVRVAHWAILDGQTLPVAHIEAGALVELAAEPFDDNPQLTGVFRSETLESFEDVPLYYDVTTPGLDAAAGGGGVR